MKLRFSLRSALAATFLACLLLGWWADHRRLSGVAVTSIHMFTKDSFEFKTSWPIDTLECSNVAVCAWDFERKLIRITAREPGEVVFTLWEKGQPLPTKLLIEVTASP